MRAWSKIRTDDGGQRRQTCWGPQVVCLDVEQAGDVVRLISTRSQSQPDVVNSEGADRVLWCTHWEVKAARVERANVLDGR